MFFSFFNMFFWCSGLMGMLFFFFWFICRCAGEFMGDEDDSLCSLL